MLGRKLARRMLTKPDGFLQGEWQGQAKTVHTLVRDGWEPDTHQMNTLEVTTVFLKIGNPDPLSSPAHPSGSVIFISH